MRHTPDPSADRMTLREAFEAFNVRDLSNPNTIGSYRGTLSAWERLTDNPPVGEISNSMLADFRKAVVAGGRSPATFNKHWTHIRAICRRLGPQEFRNPLGEGILDRIPHVRKLPEDREWPRVATFDELDRLYLAAESMTWPQCDVPTACLWQALIVVASNCGPRTQDLLGLRTADVDFETGQLRFRARKSKRQQVLPLSETTLAHLQRIATDRPELFPRALLTGRLRQQHWHALQKTAGVDPPLTLQALRKTCATRFAETAGRDVAAFVLGHSVPGVTAEFYLNPSKAIVRAVAELPQPAAFVEGASRPVERLLPRRRADWRFTPDEVTYRGTSFRLARRPLQVLQALVAAGRPLSFDDLRRVVFWDNPDVSQVTIKRHVQRLREALGTALKLPAGWNAVPTTDDRSAWFLQLP